MDLGEEFIWDFRMRKPVSDYNSAWQGLFTADYFVWFHNVTIEKQTSNLNISKVNHDTT